MGLHLWNGYGVVNVKIEEIAGSTPDSPVTAVINESTILYVPIKKAGTGTPPTGSLSNRPYDVYSQYFDDYTFLGSQTVVCYSPYLSQYGGSLNTRVARMRLYFPLTTSWHAIPNGSAIKVTDRGSGSFYIVNGSNVTFYRANNTSIGSYSTYNFDVPFCPGTTNITTGNWCITSYTQSGRTITITGLQYIGVRAITNDLTVYGMYQSVGNSNPVMTWLNNVAEFVPPSPNDPYGEGGYSGPGGGPGTGTFDLDSDVIGLPPLPTLSFASTGFTRIYNPSLSELNALANYLWTDQTFLDTVINHLKQLLENPMDAVISLSLLPCSIPNGTPEAVKVMYINTGVSMAPATTQFVDVDCGTYTIEEFYGSALDYNPYTKVHCYLPYIGQVTLDTDEVMGKTLNVVYRIDIVTGMCAAMILVDQNVLYQFSGHCAINMPINSADFSGYIGAAMTAGKMVAGVVAGAAGAPALAAELIGAPAPHSSTSETTEKSTERNPKTGRQITAGTSTRTTTRSTPGASFGELSRKAAANTVGAVMGSKLTVEHAGGFTGNSGYLAVRRPYLIIERPRMCNPEEYGKYNGRPSMIYMNLGECEGYTEVQSIQFENIPATNPELAELSELLKSGVLF